VTGKSRKGDKNRPEVFGIKESSTHPVSLPKEEKRRINAIEGNYYNHPVNLALAWIHDLLFSGAYPLT